MTGPYSETQVRLQRDALSTPWGFRLQGGKDFKTPLIVQRVFVGSPADGELHRGDAILGINSYDASNVIHKQAQDLIKNSGGTLDLIVRRAVQPRTGPNPTVNIFSGPAQPTDLSGGYRSRPLDTFSPKPTPAMGAYVTNNPKVMAQPKQQGFVPSQFGIDYTQQTGGRSYSAPPRQRGPQPGSMLDRVQGSLTYATGMPSPSHAENGQENYEQVPVNQLKQVFNQPPAPSHLDEDDAPEPRRSVKQLKGVYNKKGGQQTVKQPVRSRPRPASISPVRPAWSKPPADTLSGAPPDPGWTPGLNKPAYQPVQAPRVRAPPPQQQPQVFNQPPPQRQRPSHQEEDFRPAWGGTLKSSGGPKPWEDRVNNQIESSGGGGGPAAPVQPHQPRVQHVNYGPDGQPTYAQDGDANHENAKVAHLQYNTPIGLYSKGNVDEALTGQTAGRPGEGTMQVTSTGPGGKQEWDPTRSEVLRMLQEEERPKLPRGHGLRPQQPQQPRQPQQPQQEAYHSPPQESARYQDQAPGQEMNYGGYMDHQKQSPMMHALETQMADQEGTSDF